MGKPRRNRSGAAARRSDPIGSRPRKTVKEPADPALAALRADRVLPVVRDLRSAEPATRAAAASAVANLVEDPRCRKLLLREQVVHLVLSETLSDASVEGRAAGWAVLRVLAQHEEADFCVHLYRCDVLTPAAHALAQVVETLAGGGSDDAQKLTKGQLDFAWRIASAILDLVGMLVEARDEVLAAVAGNGAITRALCWLASGSSGSASGVAVPLEIQWAALTTLARICDDDGEGGDGPRALAEALVAEPAAGGAAPSGGGYRALLRLLDAGGGGALTVAAAALLHAVFARLEWFDHSPGPDGLSDAKLVPYLCRAVERELQGEVKPEPTPGPAGGAADVLELALQTLAVIGTTLQASLNKGNKAEEAEWDGIPDDDAAGMQNDRGVFGEDEDDEEEEEEDDDDEDHEMADGEEAAPRRAKKAANGAGGGDGMDVDMDGGLDDEEDLDMQHVTGFDDQDDDDAHATDLADLPTLRALIGDAVPQMIRIVAAHVAASAEKGDGDGNGNDNDDDDSSAAILLDTLSALNNLAWTVSLVDLADPGNAGIRQAWRPAARRIWLRAVRPLLQQLPMASAAAADSQRRPRQDVAAQVAGLAWALARVLGGTTPVDAGEPAQFMALRDLDAEAEATADSDDKGDDSDPFQSLAVKCVGVLGQMALDPAPADVNRPIGQYLLQVAGDAEARGRRTRAAAAAVEALNQLFDVYGDEAAACDGAVFWPDNLLAAMEAVLPAAKARAKSIDKRALGELRTRADEAVLNLRRFLQYKKKHRPRKA